MNYIYLKRKKLEALGGDFGTLDLIRFFVDNSQRFNTNANGIRSAIRIIDSCDKCKDEDYLPIETNDFGILKAEAESPQPMPGTMPYPINKTRLLLPYLDDIINAKETKPIKEEE